MLGTVSTNTPDSDDLAALASDPRTDWEMLHWIAEHHASLRPAVAANPGAYPELVEALGQLGDPAIDEAIRQRPDGGHDVVPIVEPEAPHHSVAHPAETDPAISDPLHQMWDPHTDDLPAQRDETADIPAQDEQPATEEPELEPESEEDIEAEQDIEPLPAPDEPAYTYPVNPAPEDYSTRAPVAATPESAPVVPAEPAYTPAPAPAYTPAPIAYSAATPAAQPKPRREPVPERGSAYDRDRDSERKGAGAKVLMAVALAAVAILGIGALIFTTLGDDEPVAQPQPAATADASPEPEETEAAEEEPTEEATEDAGANEEALAEARTSVAGLASASTCDAESEEADLITEFLTMGAESDALSAEDATMMEETFAGLQSECSTVYSASVFQGARSGVDSDAATETMETVGTDWVNRSVSIAGASTMSSFVTPDGNIQCEFDGGLRCTAYEHEYQAPAGCDAGTTYLMEVDAAAALDCSNPVADEDRETLGVDQAATDGFMACVSLDDRVSCYNALTGAGFEISERGHYPTT